MTDDPSPDFLDMDSRTLEAERIYRLLEVAFDALQGLPADLDGKRNEDFDRVDCFLAIAREKAEELRDNLHGMVPVWREGVRAHDGDARRGGTEQ
ncbi:MAG: hypothetical protein KGN33_18040 [Paracoccaceae bacterium]|nr:hypothetical protein [Paracoccaceae bacterium]